MISSGTVGIGFGLLLLPLAFFGVASQGADAQSAQSGVDANALAALDKMGAELRSHDLFVLKADVTTEDVLESGQKLQYEGKLEVQARKPDRFKFSAKSDLRERDIYYDGKAVTIHSPRLGYYASFDAPPTIAATVQKARADYDVELPLADLFTWGTDKSNAKLTSAFLVRPETIAGRKCNHYALRQDKVDWQIWIAESGPALPCKVVITKTSDPSQPQYSAVLNWSFPNSLGDETFAFAPPKDAKKIVVAKVVSR
jgi:hypothetical protein